MLGHQQTSEAGLVRRRGELQPLVELLHQRAVVPVDVVEQAEFHRKFLIKKDNSVILDDGDAFHLAQHVVALERDDRRAARRQRLRHQLHIFLVEGLPVAGMLRGTP